MTLLDAGIPLRSMAAAVEFQTTSLSENYTHTFDSSPDAQQSALAEIRTRHTICYEPSAGENGLLGVHSEGPFTPQQVLFASFPTKRRKKGHSKKLYLLAVAGAVTTLQGSHAKGD